MPFDTAVFKAPPKALRGAPFWSLNHDLRDHDRLREQIDAFDDMGLGGYHLHVRAGLQTPYMQKDFMAAIGAAREHGQRKGMYSYLYDEDTWPSGFAGGAVTTSLEFRQRWLQLQREAITDDELHKTLCAYRVQVDADGYLQTTERIAAAEADDDCWRLIVCIAPDNDRFNGAAYLDVLNPKAIDAFIASTHQKYFDYFDGDFPEDVPSIFTDEPQLARSAQLNEADQGSARLPWTDDLADTFQQAFQTDLLDAIPHVIWPQRDGVSPLRWQFWDHVSERFASAFADRIGQWCAAHGLALTGHMMAEENLGSQLGALGEAMRHYRGFQIPGIDILCDRYEPSTAKQAVSVARQDGRTRVLSELYGVTNWDFPFRGHKCQGDWQAALGITLRVHHLAWLSMEGQSKRDYPAAIGPQSPWYKEYTLIEDHYARINAALGNGKAEVKVGMLHPIETAWLHYGVGSLDGADFARQDHYFHQCIEILLEGQIDFDFVAESLLPRQECPTAQAVLQVGEMAYQVIVVPALETLRSTTLDSLEQFQQRGGTVIVIGEAPTLCDALPSQRPQTVLAKATHVALQADSIVKALEAWRDISVEHAPGRRRPHINYQLRRDGDERFLFCSHRQRETPASGPWGGNAQQSDQLRIRGQWQVTLLDTMSGEERSISQRQQNGWTIVSWQVHAHGHILLRLKPGSKEEHITEKQWQYVSDCSEPHKAKRDEANVLLLDMPAVKVNDEDWLPPRDSLMTQLDLAGRFGWPDWSQPYSVKDPGEQQRITRRFTFNTDAALTGVRLMCERLKEASATLDGTTIDLSVDGWWVDRDLTTAVLPDMDAGEHVLEITLMHDAVQRHLEWCYLLGDFQVQTLGAHARIIADSDQMFWGDAVSQGLPFYGGNIDYHVDIEIVESGDYALRAPSFGGPLLRVWCDERDCGPIAFAPYRVELGHLEAGSHRLRICAYGNRVNCFGAVHNAVDGWQWWGPQSWRLDGESRNDVWQLRPTGILRAPLLERSISD